VWVGCPCGILFVVVCMGSWLWCAFVLVVFVALVGGELFVHSSVRGVWFVGFGAALCVLCVCVLRFCGLLVFGCDDVGCVVGVFCCFSLLLLCL